jgi:hypothetical protein
MAACQVYVFSGTPRFLLPAKIILFIRRGTLPAELLFLLSSSFFYYVVERAVDLDSQFRKNMV